MKNVDKAHLVAQINKIKQWIICLDLKVKNFEQKLNPQGISTLLMIESQLDGFTGTNAIDILNNVIVYLQEGDKHE